MFLIPRPVLMRDDLPGPDGRPQRVADQLHAFLIGRYKAYTHMLGQIQGWWQTPTGAVSRDDHDRFDVTVGRRSGVRDLKRYLADLGRRTGESAIYMSETGPGALIDVGGAAGAADAVRSAPTPDGEAGVEVPPFRTASLAFHALALALDPLGCGPLRDGWDPPPVSVEAALRAAGAHVRDVLEGPWVGERVAVMHALTQLNMTVCELSDGRGFILAPYRWLRPLGE